MNILENITKEHLLAAISKIDHDGIPKDGDSQYYDVIFDGKKYPPKLIVSYANIYANNVELDRNSFTGGLNTPCFKLLEENGFVIIEKNKKNNLSYFEELKRFLVQAETGELKTSHYLREYADLKVKVSFGQGNLAKVPWISFLGSGQTTSNGIYPVYLLYKNINTLILAYGVSETKDSALEWQTNEPQLSTFFATKNLGDPKPYPNSFVFKSYDLSKGLVKETIDYDLNEIIEVYKQTLQLPNPKTSSQNPPESPVMNYNYQSFIDKIYKSNLYINEKLSLRFMASLITKPFIILTGLSGSGKTKLAQAFAMWICENEHQYCLIPVGADWTNREPLLGFPNALREKDYVKPDNKVLDLIINANKNSDKPYFLILDEMNLSHVERYFADFLSVMESKNKILLHPGTDDWNDVPAQIDLPKNLFIIGTVNIDETTYMFSPKVLDRANVIEFSVTAGEMKRYLQGDQNINLDIIKGTGSSMASSFVNIAKAFHEIEDEGSRNSLLDALNIFFIELKKIGAEFGYRSASEILRFGAVVNIIEPDWNIMDIIDTAIMQKLLPKVHGSRRKLEPVLKTLGSLCLNEQLKFDDVVKSEIDFTDTSKVKYPVSLQKIIRMYENLISNGFTSYAEA